MLSTERTDFESQLAVLFGGFPTFLTPPRIEAYWRGLQKMQLSVFVRCVDYALSESGGEKLPTVNAIWQISRNLRSVAPPRQQANDAPPVDHFANLGNRWLLAFLLNKQGASPACLPQLLAIKNRIVDQFRSSGDVCGGPTTAEWLEVATGAFDRAWQSASEDDIETACQRHGRRA